MSCLEFCLNCCKIIGGHRPARSCLEEPARKVGQVPRALAVLSRLVGGLWHRGHVETTLGGMKEMLNGPALKVLPR